MDGEGDSDKKEERSGADIGVLDKLLDAVQGESEIDRSTGMDDEGGGDRKEENRVAGVLDELLDAVQGESARDDEREGSVAEEEDASGTAEEEMLEFGDALDGGSNDEDAGDASIDVREEEAALGVLDTAEVPATYPFSQEERPTLQDPVDPEETPTLMNKDPEPPVVPPPAPTDLAVVVGSMVPVGTGDDDDEDSDSQDEGDEESHVLPPPLNLGAVSDDDDDDELEVDPAVAGAIEAQKTSTLPVKAAEPLEAKETDLLAALPTSKPIAAASSDEIEFSFADEVRAARVVVSSSSVEEPSKRGSKAPGSQDDSVESAFGISYTSLRKKRGEGDLAEHDGYSLPTASAFPDEREFESELNLSSDVSFSVKSMAHLATLADTIDADDGEFGVIDLSTAADAAADPVSPQSFETRQASLQARRTQDEAHIIEELKKATDDEKSLNEVGLQTAGAAVPAATPPVAQASESGSALTLRELHGIYKRGLGDQGVLLDESEESDSNHSRAPRAAASSGSAADSTSLSVMGRILSKPLIMTEAIAEEEGNEEEEDGDDEERSGVAVEKQSDASANHGDENGSSHSTNDSQAWQEIELTRRAAARDPVPRTEGDEGSVKGKQDSHEPRASKPAANFKISFQEAFEYCLQADEFLQQRDKIVAEDFEETGRSCFACFSPRPRLMFPSATEERDRVFCIAATGYGACSDVFSRVLQTLYTKLTRTQREVPLSGSHWEDIGFQGNDPATDLRGCGVLSLLQMLYLVDKHTELALRFHSLSQHPTRHFPLACTLINVTLQCVIALRSGALYKECNKQTSVFNAVNSFYVALASELMGEIQSSPDAIPIIMKDVLDDGRANPDRVLEQFARSTGSHEAGAQPPSSPRKPAGARETNADIAFSEIALQSLSSDEDDE